VIVSGWSVVFAIAASSALGQQANVPDEVQQGKRIALRICADCHLVAPGARQPILQPPAPSFESIAQRSTTNAEPIQTFLKTTHREIDNLKGMPNLQLSDNQIEPLTAYLLSLRKQP
jgi:mono/diheme cytochrome c family protein